MNEGNILEVEGLRTSFRIDGDDIPIIKGVSFEVKRGSTLAIVGESGCGKSVTVHSVMRLLPRVARLAGGEIRLRDAAGEHRLDSLAPYGPAIRAIRGRSIGMIFQDPMASLNPVYRVGDQVVENLLQHRKIPKKEAMRKVVDLFAELGIPDPERRVREYPHQFSGGMKQRVMIAIAMICGPELLIADEPTTALDVTIQAQIIDLMQRLKREEGTSIILITHNIGLVAETADFVAVMYMGRIVESGPIERIFHNPSHPYTRALMRSVPVPGRRGRGDRLLTIRGSTADASPERDEACEFSERCDERREACLRGRLTDREIESGHMVRCALYDSAGG